MDRPGLRQLCDLVNTKAIMAVVVYDPDRLSRKLAHQLLLVEEFELAGVALEIVSHPMEQGPEGQVLFQVRGIFAEYEHAKLLERTRRGNVKRIRDGYPGGGNVPLGYRYVNIPEENCPACRPDPKERVTQRGCHWEVDDEEAALVHRIFALCLEGKPIRAIARIVTDGRVATPSDRHPERGHRKSLPYGVWNHPTVRAVLTYQGYTGEAAWGKRERIRYTKRRRARPVSAWVTFQIPAILLSTFEAAQRALQGHQRWASRNRKRENLLAGGALRCGRCERAMSGMSRGEIRYYRCGSRHSILDPALRCSGSVRADVVEAQVWTAVVRVLEQPELIAAEITRQEQGADAKCAEIGQQLALIEAGLAKCDREAQRWADVYAGEVINLAELKGYRAEIETRRQSLLTDHAACQRQLDAIGEVVQHVEALTEYCERVRQRLQIFDHTEKRVALEALDIRVRWIPGQPLVIQGTIPFGTIADIPSKSTFIPRISR
jgi:site-specific DNA recombinase